MTCSRLIIKDPQFSIFPFAMCPWSFYHQEGGLIFLHCHMCLDRQNSAEMTLCQLQPTPHESQNICPFPLGISLFPGKQ